MEMPTVLQFLEATNRNARERKFGVYEFTRFCEHVESAKAALKDKYSYYWEMHAGGVPRSYGYRTSTARCGVYVLHGEITIIYDRVSICGKNVKCIYNGGRNSYNKEYERSKENFVTSLCDEQIHPLWR